MEGTGAYPNLDLVVTGGVGLGMSHGNVQPGSIGRLKAICETL